MSKRDNFTKEVRDTLAKRAGQRCSNLACRVVTSGPHTVSNKAIDAGVAAHICAAAPGGKRYDHNMTSKERASIDNGIWLCPRCAKLVDSDVHKYTPELLRKWKTEHENSISKELVSSGLTEKQFVEAVPQLSIQEPDFKAPRLSEPQVEARTDSDYPKATAAELVKAGFHRDRVHHILEAQDKAFLQKNARLAKFLTSYMDGKLDTVPPVWRALIAGFPIIGQDIGSQSFSDLAELIKELDPYLSKDLRRTYHERARPILMGILAESQAFLQDAAAAGGLSLSIIAAPPTLKLGPWRGYKQTRYKIDESLLQGNWGYVIPREAVDLKIHIGKTWAGFLYDIISRLPDPDTQEGKLLKKIHLMNMVFMWCSTAPQDFKPAFADIVRRPVSSSDRTLAGDYKRMKSD